MLQYSRMAATVILPILILALGKSCLAGIMFVNDAENWMADKALEAVMGFLRRNPSIEVQVKDLVQVHVNGTDPKGVLDVLCAAYGDLLKNNRPPDLVLDTTRTGVPSETVKSFTAALGIPTISTAYGQEYDIRSWRNLDEEEEKFLIQVMPPADLIPEIIRSIVVSMNISNAAILFDDMFVMDHKYKSLLQNIPTRHLITAVDETGGLRKQLTKIKELDVVNFFILGGLSTIKNVLDAATANKYFGKKYAWFTITQDKGTVKCGCTNSTVIFIKPEPDSDSKDTLGKLQSMYSLQAEPEIAAAFYFDIILRAFTTLKSMKDKGDWPREMPYVTCEDFQEETRPRRSGLNLLEAFKKAEDAPSYAPFVIDRNGHSYMEFNMKIEKDTIINGQMVNTEDMGSWKASIDGSISIKSAESMKKFTATTVYRVVTQQPFVFKNPDEEEAKTKPYLGYCIDLLDDIRQLIEFDYEIYDVEKFGNMDEQGQWNGMIKELIEKRADIGLGSLSVMAERESVIDFTVPYYDLVGITILMKKSQTPTSLFKFLTVLEKDVWFCILAAYFFTSFLMWAFDRWSPYSYQNNREKYKDDEEKREFNLKECLWFCMTSLTPQGGGEAPKNLSGRLVAATWWLFGFIIIASYTANLAAFLTVSRLDTPVESLDDLSKQYKIQYAPLNGSSAMTYFQRMADIEARFYEIWKDMSLNDSLSEVERAKLAVWDYPVSDKYTKMWQAMQEARLPNTMQEALDRVRASTSSSEGFAYLGDATDIKYQVLTNCDFQIVGEEFSRKPYAIAVQQGSPLKDQFNNAILQLLNKRRLEKLKEIWWAKNPKKAVCENQNEETDGISIQNIGGVFIVIFVGIGLACITLAFEYWWYRHKRSPRVRGKEPAVAGGGQQAKTAFGQQNQSQYLSDNLYPDRFMRGRGPANLNLPTVEQPW